MISTQVDFDRDSQARVYATQHLDFDSGVVQIFYLPTNAPDREIRLLEVNRLIPETPPTAIDFGVAIDGPDAHKLIVFDVTPTQWEAIEQGSLMIPDGWTLEDSQELARR